MSHREIAQNAPTAKSAKCAKQLLSDEWLLIENAYLMVLTERAQAVRGNGWEVRRVAGLVRVDIRTELSGALPVTPVTRNN